MDTCWGWQQIRSRLGEVDPLWREDTLLEPMATHITAQHSLISRLDVHGHLRWHLLCHPDVPATAQMEQYLTNCLWQPAYITCVSLPKIKHEPAHTAHEAKAARMWGFVSFFGGEKVCSVNRSKVRAISRISAPRRSLFTKPTPGGTLDKHMEYQTPSPSHGSVYTQLQNLAELLWHL